MAKVKTSELTGAALDWAVAKCEGRIYGKVGTRYEFQPSTNWAQGGPIIGREGISWHCGNKSNWHAYTYGSHGNISGPSPLVAAMRCYVVSKLGEFVNVPDELV